MVSHRQINSNEKICFGKAIEKKVPSENNNILGLIWLEITPKDLTFISLTFFPILFYEIRAIL